MKKLKTAQVKNTQVSTHISTVDSKPSLSKSSHFNSRPTVTKRLQSRYSAHHSLGCLEGRF